MEVGTAEIGREDRGRAIGHRGWCGKHGTRRRRDARGVQRGLGNTMLRVTVTSPRPVYMGEVGAYLPWQAVIEQFVEAGECKPAPQYAKHHDGGKTPDYPVRHSVMILHDHALGPGHSVRPMPISCCSI
jgi:hypothetical protein